MGSGLPVTIVVLLSQYSNLASFFGPAPVDWVLRVGFLPPAGKRRI
jgi:hypothetical protein